MWVLPVCLLAFGGVVAHTLMMPMPAAPPPRPAEVVRFDRTIRLDIEYDQTFAAQHGEHAYYLFHPLGHCWDANDIPFLGGETTYGSKTRMTFDIDAGNEEIMDDSPGPVSRSTAHRAPMVLREKLARARAVARDLTLYPAVHDALLHEPSPANPAYIEKKGAILAAAGDQRAKIADLFREFEITRRQMRDDAEVRQQIAEHYWRANDAIRQRDYERADAELQLIRAIRPLPDVHMLIGAVAKKVKRSR